MSGGHLFEPLRQADYRRLWFGQLVSVMGDKVDQIALGILVYQATGSELQMGIMLAISMLPTALFGMVAGAYVDRLDRRKTMIGADLGRATLVLSVPFVAEYSLPAVYVIAFLVAGVSLFFEPAKLSLIPDLVGTDDLMAANSLDNATVSAAELAGLAFAASLVASVGYRAAFYFDAVTFLVSALFILAIRHRAAAAEPRGVSARGLLSDVSQGLRYLGRHTVLRDLLPVYSVAMAGVAASVTFVYVLALDRFDSGATGLAIMDGAITVGLLIGSVIIGRMEPTGTARKLLWGLTAFGVLLALASVVPSVIWAVPLLLVMGIANMFFFVPMTTIIQTLSLPSMRGRSFAAKQTLSRILSVIGFVGAGALAEAFGLSSAILIISAVIAMAALAGWLRPQLRAA